MIADLKPYPEYKESGSAWIGIVPRHWNVTPNRALFEEVKDRNHPDEEMLSVTITRGIIRQKALLSETSKKDSSNLNKSAYKLVQPGDLAYNKMRAWQGAVGASHFRGIISPAYVVMRPREGCNPAFYHHLYRTPSFQKEAERWSYGITSDMWSLRPEHFKVIYSVLPPPSEQAAIVRFLDWANGRLERAIRAKRKVIALLHEQKQAIIHKAVTQGLDPNVPKRDSGIPWLGEIPAHWEIIPLGALTKYISYGFTNPMPVTEQGPYMVTAADITGGKIQYTTARHTSNYAFQHLLSDKSRPQAGDLLITKDGTLGRIALADGTPVCINQSVALLRLFTDRVAKEFVAGALQAAGYQKMMIFNAGGSTIKHIYITRLVKMKIALPPTAEQGGIAADIERTTTIFDGATAKIECEITLLREYRTRLVADVVTGKLDVREAALSLPEEDLPLGSEDAQDEAEEPELEEVE
jgi:type I restriction enzyme S subunit